MVKTIEEIKQCPACGSDNLVYARSKEQIICRDCGLVHEPFSSVAKDVLEITQPAESALLAVERVTVKPPRTLKAKPARRKKPVKPKARKITPKTKKARPQKAKKSVSRKAKPKTAKIVRHIKLQKQMPITPQPKPAKLGFRARLRKLVRR